MSDPKRLLHGAGGPLAAELLAAGRDELPSEAALSRALERAALAAGAAATLPRSMLKAAPAARDVEHGVLHQSVGVAAGAAKGGISIAVLSKWVIVAAVGIGGTSAIPSARRWLAPDPVLPTVAQPATPAELAGAAAPGATEPRAGVVTPAASAARPTETAHRSEAPPIRTPARVPRATNHSTLDELRLVDGAREALQSGDAARALRLLERYESKIVDRQFELEVGVLRMEALARLGRSDAAQRQARQLLTQNLSERQAARARSILDGRASFQ